MPEHSLAIVLLGLVVMLVTAKAAGAVMERLRQPSVIGELLVGIIIGNLRLFGTDIAEPLRNDVVLAALAEIGVILLLFEVGLESNVGQMLKVGVSSFLVALLGVIAPMGLGYLVTRLLHPELPLTTDLFIAATLAATSVGITARVFRDLGVLDRPESRIVLGAAVIDDVMGLVVLAVVQGMVLAAAGGHELDGGAIAVVVVKALVFLAGAIVVGGRIAPYLFRAASFLRVHGMLLVTALAVCFVFAWLADRVGLAAIVGAFAAGLVLDEVSYRDRFADQKLDVQIRPLSTVLVPLFFVRMGIAVDLRAFARGDVLLFAGLLTAAAVIGKQVCGLGVTQRGLDRLSIGLGMIPRGEVGLIVADAGRKLSLGGAAVVDESTFSAVVIVVVLTTLATPPVLAWSLRRHA